MASVPSAIRVPLRALPAAIHILPARSAPRIATLDCPDRVHKLARATAFAFVTAGFMLCVLLAAIAAHAAFAGLLAGLAAVAAFASWLWNFTCAALISDRWVFDGGERLVWREERPWGAARESVASFDQVRRVVLHAVFQGAGGARYVWTPLVQLSDGRMLRSGSCWLGTWDGPHAAPEPPDHLVELGRELSSLMGRPLEVVLGRSLMA